MRIILFRALDIVAAAAATVFALPLIALIALLIILDSRGPVLVRHRQVRPNGGEFDLMKFRTQRIGGDVQSGRSRHGPGDRLSRHSCRSRIGTILWRTRFDEIPILINIMRGELPILGHYTWREVLDWLNSTDTGIGGGLLRTEAEERGPRFRPQADDR